MPMKRQQYAPLKKGEFKQNIVKLLGQMKPYLAMIIVSIVFTLAATVLSIFAPQILSQLTDEITVSLYGYTIDMSQIAYFAAILIIFYVCNAICTYVSSYLMTTVSQKLCYTLRRDVSGKLNKVPLKYFDSHAYGDTLSIVTNDIDTIGNSMHQAVSMVIQSVFMLTGVLIAMFVTCWQLALTVLIAVPVMLVLLGIIMKFSQPQFRKQQNELGAIRKVFSARQRKGVEKKRQDAQTHGNGRQVYHRQKHTQER